MWREHRQERAENMCGDRVRMVCGSDRGSSDSERVRARQ